MTRTIHERTFDVPVLFLIFNRPSNTQRVFNVLKMVKPRFLYVAADGPRDGNNADIARCSETRDILKQVDWDCELKTLYREKNYGVKFGVSSAISWFFENVEEGIILEDDCVPDVSLFPFMREMLERYRGNERIMHINGTNFLMGKKLEKKYSYYFSNLPHVWGWATWRRAWSKYDIDMKDFLNFRKSGTLERISNNQKALRYWERSLENVYQGKLETWDIQWFYSVWNNGGLSVTPAVNLITNIGFGADATHTLSEETRIGGMRRYALDQLKHPEEMLVNRRADEYAARQRGHEWNPTLFDKVKAKLKIIMNKIFN